MNDSENHFPPYPDIILRLKDLFLHPIRFMELQGFDASPWLPLLLMALTVGLLQIALLPELLANYDEPDFQAQYAEKHNVTIDEARTEIGKLKKSAPYLGFLEAPIVVVGGAGGISAVLYMIGWLRFKSRMPFVLVFHMVAWGSLVGIVPIGLQLIMRFINPETTFSTNAAALLGEASQDTYLYNILLAVDPFLVWQVWLLGLGMAAIYGVSRQRAVTSVGTMFIILSILNAIGLTLTAGQPGL
jgi:hypothetical protein